MAKKLIAVRIDENLKIELDKLVNRLNKTQTELIENALNELIRKKKAKKRYTYV